MKVIVVEDERSIFDAIRVAFEFRWPEATVMPASGGREGVRLIRKEHPDIVILDINLPDINGFAVLKEVREFSSVPVIILTVRSDDTDVLRGLEAGADDYVTKPFNYMTLLARVRAVLRRAENQPIRRSHDTAVSSRLKIDFVNQRVAVDGRPVKLTPVEYRLLVFLVKNKNSTVSYKSIVEDVWQAPYHGETENIRIYVRRLRRKLGDEPASMILNRRGSGYMLKV
jgi:two-component system KDP operon response regulator KdpE